RSDPFPPSAVLLNQATYCCLVSAGLLKTVFFFGEPTDKQAVAIPEGDLTLATAELGFDCEHTAGSDDDMIDVESVRYNVMDRLVAVDSQLLQKVSNMTFAAVAAVQSSCDRKQSSKPDRSNACRDDCYIKPKLRPSKKFARLLNLRDQINEPKEKWQKDDRR